jgi:hypothetical protein
VSLLGVMHVSQLMRLRSAEKESDREDTHFAIDYSTSANYKLNRTVASVTIQYRLRVLVRDARGPDVSWAATLHCPSSTGRGLIPSSGRNIVTLSRVRHALHLK